MFQLHLSEYLACLKQSSNCDYYYLSLPRHLTFMVASLELKCILSINNDYDFEVVT